ncbi:hypothetical protein CY0110_32360 [Crocosphaera chwakensis CCY0110]|uniref:Uncharacterized protein n=1 Tax=Crocosphaera chwakensis CCY0110 TaxID=391612 RepID=A3IS60_9CHRO|nr:hypothetical protein CY0110_32360 [Crocosphaera chwakensis CCY0110]
MSSLFFCKIIVEIQHEKMAKFRALQTKLYSSLDEGYNLPQQLLFFLYKIVVAAGKN